MPPLLYLVTDKSACLDRPLEWVVEEAILGGVGMVQYREKDFSYAVHWEEAQRVRDVCLKHNTPLLINDRVDLALALSADGVHLGQSDMDWRIARRILGSEKWIGLSVESWEDWQTLKTSLDYDLHQSHNHPPDPTQKPDYLGVSPIFSTPTKTDTKGSWGLAGLRRLREDSEFPLVAIGRVSAENACAIRQAGAHSLAVVSAICSAQNPRLAAETILESLDSLDREKPMEMN